MMRKVNFFKILDGIVYVTGGIAVGLSLVATLLLLIDSAAVWCDYYSFLSYSDTMTCVGVLTVGVISLALVGVYTAVTAKPESVQMVADEESLTEAIASNHGDNLATVMEAIRNEPLEYRALFDDNERKLTEGTLNSPERSNVPIEEWKRVYSDIYIDLHNHPGPSQSSFSCGDYRAMVESRARYMVVVTRSINYIMENPYWNRSDGPSEDEVGDYAQSLSEKHVLALAFFTRTYSRYISRCVAKKFGLKYHVERFYLRKFGNSMKQLCAAPRRIAATGIMAGMVIMTGLTISSGIAGRADNTIADADARNLTITDEDVDWGRYEAIRRDFSTDKKPNRLNHQADFDASTGEFQSERPPMIDHAN